MPCKSFACEFCHTEFRKDALAIHVKAKHIKELGAMLLSELKDSDFSAINRYCKNVKHNPIYSVLHVNAVYIFGVKPQFFPDDKDSHEISNYIKSEENLEAHNRFIEEVLQTISLMDFIQHQRNVQIKSIEMIKKSETVRQQQVELELLKIQSENTREYVTKLEGKIAEYEEYYDTKDTITDIKNNNLYLQRRTIDLERKLRLVEASNTTTAEEYDDKISYIREQHMKELEYYQAQVDTCKKTVEDFVKENEKLKTRVKAEAEKLLQKEKERKKKAKKQLKKAKALAKLAESDSESDSNLSSSDSD